MFFGRVQTGPCPSAPGAASAGEEPSTPPILPVHRSGRLIRCTGSRSLATIQWVSTGYALALSMAIPLTGWAVERFGPKTLWILSLGLFISGSILCGAAWSVGSLIAFRILQGFGGGMLMPVGQTMLARAAGPERMGRMMAVIAVPAMLAPVLGPVLGGVIVDHLSWRWMFYVNVPFCALALVMAVRLLPRDTDRRPGRRLDVLGLALLSPGLAALVYGLSEAGNGSAPTSARVLLGLGAGVVLLAAFGVHALRRGREALVDLSLFRSRAFAASTAALFCYAAGVIGLTVLLPLYFQLVRHESPLHAGLLIAPWGLGAMLTMPVSGRITDRIGPRGVGLAGVLVVLLGMLPFTRIAVTTSTATLVGAVFAVGLGHGLVMPSLMAAMYQGLDKASVPAATTAGNILVRVGGAFGTALLAVVLQIYIRADLPGTGRDLASVATVRTPAAPALLTGDFAGAFWWAVAVGAVALVPLLLLPRRRSAGADPAG
ncbi:MDR family MFS transporter [Actinomadura scrupuli]|uniref:MDR family MFS transporter n=1 Tax=Actinomadura scrupuli TaxID=559629 RepID=UPI003D99EEAF